MNRALRLSALIAVMALSQSCRTRPQSLPTRPAPVAPAVQLGTDSERLREQATTTRTAAAAVRAQARAGLRTAPALPQWSKLLEAAAAIESSALAIAAVADSLDGKQTAIDAATAQAQDLTGNLTSLQEDLTEACATIEKLKTDTTRRWFAWMIGIGAVGVAVALGLGIGVNPRLGMTVGAASLALIGAGRALQRWGWVLEIGAVALLAGAIVYAFWRCRHVVDNLVTSTQIGKDSLDGDAADKLRAALAQQSDATKAAVAEVKQRLGLGHYTKA